MRQMEMFIFQRVLSVSSLSAWLVFAPLAAKAEWTDEIRSRGPTSALEIFNRIEAQCSESALEILANAPWLKGLAGLAVERNGALALFGIAMALGLLCLMQRRRRRTGTLTLRLIFPDTVEGHFNVSIHRKRANANRISTGSRASETRCGVRRETQFDHVLPGKWFITVEGQLDAPISSARLAWVTEEIEVEIKPQGGTIIDHALPAAQTPVEFRVHWDRQPADDVGIRRAENPDSLRYAGHGHLKSALPLGEHDFLIGAGDRVVGHRLRIDDYEPKRTEIDLAASEQLVFKGCPPAVTPFLQGDLGDAARALERDGQAEVASLLRAQLHQSQGQTERAAEQLENAGRVQEAAELRRSISDFDRAAALFEGAGDLRQAAEMWNAAGNASQAAKAYAAVEDWDEAVRCFESAGDDEGLVGALKAQGELLRAAALAADRGDRGESIRLLQQIAPQDSRFGRASELLAAAFEQEGHFDLAANQLERRLAALAPGETVPEIEFHLAELLEHSGEYERAMSILETLRERDPTFPQVGAKIEVLRKKRATPIPYASGNLNLYDSGSRPPAGATAFVAEERYEILEEVGRGGMGLIFKARDRRLGRIVALKRMPENLREHPGAVQLFLSEAQASARMNHPNIVTLYDADQENGAFFITMELLEGLPLNEILTQRGRFGPRDSARLALQVCAGLGYAHEKGIVHRDIKTANLFITRDRVLKIMDFGLAKILEAVRDKGSTLIAGTPYYMAPEQSTGKVTDGRTDLYSLGVTLFELSTGKLPFSEGDVAEQHRTLPLPDPSRHVPDYPEQLRRLIHHMTAKSPEDRPGSAEEVAQVLTQIIDTP